VTRPNECPTCAADPRAAPGRYCASNRCLCAHPACHAFASWAPLPVLNVTPIRRKPARNAWANREDSTWIDQM
jgi:hypothetical protein